MQTLDMTTRSEGFGGTSLTVIRCYQMKVLQIRILLKIQKPNNAVYAHKRTHETAFTFQSLLQLSRTTPHTF